MPTQAQELKAAITAQVEGLAEAYHALNGLLAPVARVLIPLRAV